MKQFLATESPLKLTRNAFYFTLQAVFILKIVKFLSLLLGNIEKQLDYKDKVNFNIYDVTN